MPKPSPAQFDLNRLLQDVIFSQKVVHPDFKLNLTVPDKPVILEGDERLLGQALTNIVKNACEALADRPADTEIAGQVDVRLRCTSVFAQIEIEDNGPGFPISLKEQVLEPYVTAKQGGTGLGLAIVHRIIMDHGGRLHLASRNPDHSGAIVQVSLPIQLSERVSRHVSEEEPA